ncbi:MULTISPECIES: hypothetical protein [Salinicola]|uniref:Uncharacterized protein n=1 Tax=Salinicola socius TaxID=404433 RepID=A0A1Q8SWR3_9GAMM|nr:MULTISPECIES: hypothetical protein [Salinicola]OLO05854.1 hypothetical protein BTW07_02635 [Salinicola socius]
MSRVLILSAEVSRRLAPLLVLTLLAGCQSSMGPMSWTSGYRQVAVANPQSADVTVGQMATLPNLCQSQPEDEGLITLPPGCANDLNLQLMVADPRDLTHGRDMGPAMAGPVAKAASERLDDRARANERRAMLENEARSAMGNTATTGGL